MTAPAQRSRFPFVAGLGLSLALAVFLATALAAYSVLEEVVRVAGGTAATVDTLRHIGWLGILGFVLQAALLGAVAHAFRGDAVRHAQKAAALEAENASLRSVLDGATQVAIIAYEAPPAGLITSFNPGAERMLGYTAAEMVGRATPLAFHDEGEVEARARELSAELENPVEGVGALAAKARLFGHEERDWALIRKDGGRLAAAVSTTPSYGPDHSIRGFIAIAKDVSDERSSARRVEVQHAAALALSESADAEDAVPRLLAALGTSLGFAFAAYWTVDAGAETLRPTGDWAATTGLEAFVAKTRQSIVPVGADLPGRVLATGLSTWVDNLRLEPNFGRAAEAASAGLHAALAVPVGLADVQGVIELFSQKAEAPDPRLLDVIRSVGSQFAQVLERDAADKAARVSSERTKTVIENMLEGLILVDQANTIVSVNPAAERIFGYAAWELLGQPFSLLLPEPPAEEETGAQFQDTGVMGRITDWNGRRKNGEVFPFDLALYELPAPEGRLFAGHVRDVSEKLHREQTRKEFVQVVSRELRTPLGSIREALALLSSRTLGDLPDEARDALTAAARGTVRVIDLVDDILDLEHLEAGDFQLQSAPTPLLKVVENALDAVRPLADERAVRFQVTLPAVDVVGDRDRLVQMLENLLANAVEFSNRGRAVEIFGREEGAEVEVRVVDEGRGIPQEARALLFQRFQRAGESGTPEGGGTGLGLAISRVIVERHGGHIGVESEVGHGSTFWFRLPIAAKPATRLEPPPPRPVPPPAAAATPAAVDDAEPSAALAVFVAPVAPAAAPPTPTAADREGHLALDHGFSAASGSTPPPPVLPGSEKGSDVLVVDKSDVVSDRLQRQLTAAGVAVRTARSAREAVSEARRQAPGLIVLDLNLTDGTGFDVVASLREDDGLRDLPLVVYTDVELSNEERRRLRLGRTRFLTKSKAAHDEVRDVTLDLLRSAASSGSRP